MHVRFKKIACVSYVYTCVVLAQQRLRHATGLIKGREQINAAGPPKNRMETVGDHKRHQES